MKNNFLWNPHSDQPDNIVPRKKRFFYHLKHADSYAALVWPNLRKSIPILYRHRKNRKAIYRVPVPIENPFAVSVSPSVENREEILELLRELGVDRTLVRIPSWERDKLGDFEIFYDFLKENSIELMLALLQQREDVLDSEKWQQFLQEVFSAFSHKCAYFEVGHAWNRTKWGVWDHKEYLQLAHAAFSAAEGSDAKLVGPAVIDFEFHVYAPLLRFLPFDKISSLLYVDRVGAPENTQFGWDLSRKVSLLKAIVDSCAKKGRDLWITEVNWPLEGTGKYSPAAGRPNVSEEDQADFLVRYYILALCSGFVERIYWWQLAAPGYGLVDSREKTWRKRPSFFAFKTLIEFLKDSIYEGQFTEPGARIFVFCKKKEVFAVGWTTGEAFEYSFPGRLLRIVNRDGEEIPLNGNKVVLDSSPKYLIFKEES